jgi:hypothetical protein
VVWGRAHQAEMCVACDIPNRVKWDGS